MFLKNLRLALRNLKRNKFYALINIGGLSIGMAAALLLFIWVNNELSYDNFHTQKEQLYRINSDSYFGGNRHQTPKTPLPLAQAVKEEIPEIAAITTDMQAWDNVYRIGDKLVESQETHLVSPDFFKLFDIEMLTGNAQKAFENPSNVLLSESFAKKLFGDYNPTGQTVKMRDSLEFRVAGLFADLPVNSVLKYEALIPISENAPKFINENSRQWGSFNFETYALLKPEAEITQVEEKLSRLLFNRSGRDANDPEDVKEKTFLNLQLVQDIYLNESGVEQGWRNVGDLKIIRLMAILGLLILGIACINYINLTTARAAHRAKSVGVQKIIGASRKQLFGQHLLEATLVVLVSATIAAVIADLALPYFENLLDKKFPDNAILSPNILPIVVLTILVTILLSGLHPAWQLSAFKPLTALKNKQLSGKGTLRKVLVISQFACSGALIICTLFMMRQMDFVRQSKLGYEKEHIFSFWQNPKKSLLIKQDLLNQPGVEEVTLSNRTIANINSMYGGFKYDGMPEGMEPSIYNVATDSNYPEFFGLELAAGSWFRAEGNDTKSFLINEKAAEVLQINNPVGKKISMWSREGTIVGVVKDFHFRSLHHEIQPLMFEQNDNWYYNTYIKTTGARAADAIAAAERVYKKHHPNSVFKYEFLDDTYDNLYRSESSLSQLFSIFSLLTIFISCLGIFGLATYTAERRSKEISIRKVLGASSLSIVNLLSLDFLKLVFASLIISIPVAWYFMSNWLNDFAFKIPLGWGVFALTAVLTILIAYLTIGYQSVRAALVNPAETLKSE